VSQPYQERVDWVDEDGRPIATVTRAEMRRRNLLHRVTATFVFHPDGRLFVQQRTATKDAYPGLFDMVVGGTVVSGETYEENACREIAEELGVRGVPVYHLFAHRFRDATTNSLIRVYACEYDGPVVFQPEEVADGFWAGLERVEALLDAGRMCPDSAAGWALFRRHFPTARTLADLTPGREPIDCTCWVPGPFPRG